MMFSWVQPTWALRLLICCPQFNLSSSALCSELFVLSNCWHTASRSSTHCWYLASSYSTHRPTQPGHPLWGQYELHQATLQAATRGYWLPHLFFYRLNVLGRADNVSAASQWIQEVCTRCLDIYKYNKKKKQWHRVMLTRHVSFMWTCDCCIFRILQRGAYFTYFFHID